jgi:hypothetical protein
MAWRNRLHELVLAGGSIALAGCSALGMPGGRCNANPDPCCLDPKGSACVEYTACAAAGGVVQYVSAPDSGTSESVCVTPDAGAPDLSAPVDLADASHD